MKALSVKHPWAGFIKRESKLIETRTWKTDYRGDILICASKIPVKDSELNDADRSTLGKALCIVELYKIEVMTKEHEKDALCPMYPGAYAWHFRNIRVIEPFPVRGMQRLFNVEF